MFVLDYLQFGHFILILFITQSIILLHWQKKIIKQNQELSGLRKEVEALLLCERGLADRIKNQQQQMHGIANRQDTLEITDSSQINYKHAIALMKKGASTDELVETCDISRGEVELISHFENLKRSSGKQKVA